MKTGWREQWERVLLGFARIEKVYRGREGGSAEAVYDLYSFLLTAYHLKDWLAQDPATGLTQDQIVKAMKKSTELKVCRDFATRVKHVNLNRPEWLDKATGITRQDVNVKLGVGVSHSWTIAAKGQSHDALDLARGVVDAWTAFLKGKGLL